MTNSGREKGSSMVGLGIDAVDVARFRSLLARRPGISRRLFTEDERAYAARLADPAPSLAARFAAKEATMKALGVGVGAFRWCDVEVRRAEGGRPSLLLRGQAAALAGRHGVESWQVSLTHTASVAGAVVAALS
ncbi:MAG TPA: holo-ACP synthase [Acidimicrobiales bacterium]|jgi:holo-[acyl-carrier protein] synthase